MLFNASKTQFLHLSTQKNLPDNYPLYFDNTHLSPSSTLDILGLSFIKFNKKSHISSLAKSASNKLGVLCHLHQFFFPYQLLNLYRGLIHPCMEHASYIWGVLCAHRVAKLDWVKSFSSCWLPSSNWLSSTSYTPPQYCISCYLLPLFSC